MLFTGLQNHRIVLLGSFPAHTFANLVIILWKKHASSANSWSTIAKKLRAGHIYDMIDILQSDSWNNRREEILDTRAWTTVTIFLMFNTQAKYNTLMLPNLEGKPQFDVSPPIFECRQLDVRFVWILFESMQHLGRASLIILQFFNRFYRIYFEIRVIISKWSYFRKQFLKNILIELDCLIVYFNLKHHRNNLEVFWWFFKCGLRRV